MLRIIGIGEEFLFLDLSLPIYSTHVVMDSPWTHTRHDNSFQLWCHCQIISKMSIADTAGVFKLRVAHFDLQIFTLPRSEPTKNKYKCADHHPGHSYIVHAILLVSQVIRDIKDHQQRASRRRNAKLTSKLQLLVTRNI